MSRLNRHKLKPLELSTDEPIGKRLAKLRKANGLTQAELAEKIGVSRAVIMDFERNKNHLYDEAIIRIANAIGVSCDKLLGVTKIEGLEKQLNWKIINRMQKIAELSPDKQKKVLENIDIVIKGVQG